MENRRGTSTLSPTTAASDAPTGQAGQTPAHGNRPASAGRTTPASPWLVSPAFDLLFVANLGWLLTLLPGFASTDGYTPVSFWQLYFLTVPHRWLTLGLVLTDPDRRGERTWAFVTLAAIALVLVAGVRLASGGFVCLLLLDYLWNGWHFASQHAGILRMYARKGQAEASPTFEKQGLRIFICYVIARTAGWATGWLETMPTGMGMLHWADLAMLAIPALLIILELRSRTGRHLGKRVYLLSVCSLYSGLLIALSWGHTPLVLALTVAAAWFHAAEYLAIVTIYAQKRRQVGSAGMFRELAGRWLLLLACFMGVLGCIAYIGERDWGDWWIGINLWAALLHYTYDGMIWKLRRPATASALGVASQEGNA